MIYGILRDLRGIAPRLLGRMGQTILPPKNDETHGGQSFCPIYP